ncbi:MAG: GPP34 family phosphoprotein, partial [Kiritimatiellia bacterium]|nr:GPP34 family phosphoprotein [Kiritimatiellia bacterium]
MNFAEILFLLALDEERGLIRPEMERSLDYALAGAILMDLALQNRIDTDLTCIRHDPREESRDPLLLRVVDKKPTGDVLLDEALVELQHRADPR